MNGRMILFFYAALLAAAYICLGGLMHRRWGVDASRRTPAAEKADGKRYRPAGSMRLACGQAALTVGSGAMLGAAVGAPLGWSAALLAAGISAVLGGVQGAAALLVSVRHEGEGIGAVIETHMSSRSRQAFQLIAFLMCAAAVAAFARVAAQLAAVYPAFDGIFLKERRWAEWAIGAAACSALSGLSGLAASELAAARLGSERDVRLIGLGGPLVGGLIAAALIALGAAIRATSGAAQAETLKGALLGTAALLDEAGLAVMVLLCLSVPVTALRIGKSILLQRFSRSRGRAAKAADRPWICMLIVLLAGAALLWMGRLRLCLLFGVLALLTGALVLFACAVWLAHAGRSPWALLLLAGVQFLAAACALGWIVYESAAQVMGGAGMMSANAAQCVLLAVAAIAALLVLFDGVCALREAA